MDQRNSTIDHLTEQIRLLESGPLSGINAAVSAIPIEHLDGGDHLTDSAATVPHPPPPFTNSPATTSSGKHMPSSGVGNNGLHYGQMRNGHGSGPLNPQDFIAQLAVTRQLIYQVLEQHDALPDSKSASLLRRNPPSAYAAKPTPNVTQNNVPNVSSKTNKPPKEVSDNKQYYQAMTHANANSIANHSMYDINTTLNRQQEIPPPPPRQQPPIDSPPMEHVPNPPPFVSNESKLQPNQSSRNRKGAIISNQIAMPVAEEKHDYGSPVSANNNKTPISTSNAAKPPSSTGQSLKRIPSVPAQQSPVASNLNNMLSSPPMYRKNAILTPPNNALANFSGAVTTSVDRNGTPITTVDLAMRSNLRKLTKSSDMAGANVNLLASPTANKSPLNAPGIKYRK